MSRIDEIKLKSDIAIKAPQTALYSIYDQDTAAAVGDCINAVPYLLNEIGKRIDEFKTKSMLQLKKQIQLASSYDAIHKENAKFKRVVEVVKNKLREDGYMKNGDEIIPKIKVRHGSCCCCLECGQYHDDCVCSHNDWIKFFNDLAALKEQGER